MGNSDDPLERPDTHLRDIADGCGCTEIWEHTSAAREETSSVREDVGKESIIEGNDEHLEGGEKTVE